MLVSWTGIVLKRPALLRNEKRKKNLPIALCVCQV